MEEEKVLENTNELLVNKQETDNLGKIGSILSVVFSTFYAILLFLIGIIFIALNIVSLGILFVSLGTIAIFSSYLSFNFLRTFENKTETGILALFFGGVIGGILILMSDPKKIDVYSSEGFLLGKVQTTPEATALINIYEKQESSISKEFNKSKDLKSKIESEIDLLKFKSELENLIDETEQLKRNQNRKNLDSLKVEKNWWNNWTK